MSVDPRIGHELEKLNNSCEKINSLEVSLGKIKISFFFSLFCWQKVFHHLPIIKKKWKWKCTDELKRNYVELQETSQSDIKIISSRIKSAIDLARPFYEARKQSNELLKEKLVEHANYEKAKTNLSAAKEMVHLAEQSALTVRKLINWKFN